MLIIVTVHEAYDPPVVIIEGQLLTFRQLEGYRLVQSADRSGSPLIRCKSCPGCAYLFSTPGIPE